MSYPGSSFQTSNLRLELPGIGNVPTLPEIIGDTINVFSSRPLKDRAMQHLADVNERLGKKPCSGLSIGQFIKVVRRAFQVLPFDDVADTFGLSSDELAEIVSYNAMRKKRRMNPLNPTALTRSMTRIKAFDRRCKRVNAMMKRRK